jgi:hypothetical protein
MHKNNSIDHGIVAVDSNLYNTKANLKQTKTRRKQQIIKRTEFNSCTVQVKTRQGTYHTLEKKFKYAKSAADTTTASRSQEN